MRNSKNIFPYWSVIILILCAVKFANIVRRIIITVEIEKSFLYFATEYAKTEID